MELAMASKITKPEFDRLNGLFQAIEPPADNFLYSSGDHYTLYKLLCDLGFRPKKDAIDVYAMAERVLLNGYE